MFAVCVHEKVDDEQGCAGCKETGDRLGDSQASWSAVHPALIFQTGDRCGSAVSQCQWNPRPFSCRVSTHLILAWPFLPAGVRAESSLCFSIKCMYIFTSEAQILKIHPGLPAHPSDRSMSQGPAMVSVRSSFPRLDMDTKKASIALKMAFLGTTWRGEYELCRAQVSSLWGASVAPDPVEVTDQEVG